MHSSRSFFLIIFFSLFLSFFSLLSSGLESSETSVDEFGASIDSLPDDPDAAKEAARDYLFKEWNVIFDQSPFFRSISLLLERISPVTSPASKMVFGVEPSLSWAFLLIVVLWFVFWRYVLWALELTSPFSRITILVLSLSFTIVLGVSGFFRFLTNAIISLFSLLDVWWGQLFFMLGLLVGLMLAYRFARIMRKAARKKKEEDAKFDEALDRRKLKGTVETAETFVKKITKD